MERLEVNTHYTANLNQKLDYGLYFHTNKKDTSADNNNDGFRDDPTGKQLNVLNRFQYTNLEKGLVGFLILITFSMREFMVKMNTLVILYLQRIKIIGVVKQTQKS